MLEGIKVAQEIADILMTRGDVQAVVLCGSLATQLADTPEDVDINIFTDHPPPKAFETKRHIEKRLGLSPTETMPGSPPEIHHRGWAIHGLSPWSVKEIEDMLADIVGANAEGIDTGICGAISSSQVLSDPKEIVWNWKQRLASYPSGLRKRIVEYEFPRIIYHAKLLITGAARSDTPYVLFLRNDIMQRSAKLMLAVNGVWDMAPKWILHQLRRLPDLCPTLMDDLGWIATGDFGIEEYLIHERVSRLVRGLTDLVSVTCAGAKLEQSWFANLDST